MAGTGVLSEARLNSNEINSIPVDVRLKIEKFINNRTSQFEDLRTKHERLLVSSEQQYLEVDSKLQAITSKLESKTAQYEELQTDKSKLAETFKEVESKLKSYQEAEECNLARKLTKDNEILESEKRDLTLLLEKKNNEIENLNSEWKRLTEQVSKSESAKVEAQVKLSEVQSHFVSVESQNRMLQQTIDQTQKQIDWLNKDLNTKTKELYNSRREQSSKLLDIQSQLQLKTEEVSHLQNAVETLTNTNKEQTNKIENYIKKLEDAKYLQIQSEEQYRQELEGRKRLGELYKTSASEAENKVDELTRAVDELRKLLKDASTAYTDLEEEKKAAEEQLMTEISNKETAIEKLKQELVNANDLIQEARSRGASAEQVESLFPTAAATSKLLKSGMTLTQIYNEYVQASEALLLEKEENQRLNQDLNDIIAEIEEKAPILKKQKEDYENAIHSVEQLSKQLDAAMLDCQNYRAEAEQTTRKYNMMQRENHRLQQQTVDLSKQVQYLVKEIEEVRGGRVVNKREISSSDVTSSSHVITEDLVTFGSIEELHEQNKALIQTIRQLNEKKKEDETLATESRTKELKDQLDRALKEVQELSSARERQAELVKGLVNQRDMFRVLLQQKGEEVIESLHTPKRQSVSAIRVESPDLERSLEEKTKALKQLQEDFDNYKIEMKENQKMLNDHSNKLQNELSDLKVQNMKLSSQLDFSGERYKVLQSNADSYRKEIGALREKEKKLSTSIAKHEQTINTLRQDLLKVQENAARAETQCQNLKVEKELMRSAEQRMIQELENARKTQASQSMVMANLQSIQNSLERSEFDTKTRYTNKIEKLEMDIKSLQRKINKEEGEREAVKTCYENQIKNMRRQSEAEQKSHLIDKSNLSSAHKEISTLKAKITDLESKLANALNSKAAEPSVRSDSGVHVDREEVKNLKSELEDARREVHNLTEQLGQSRQHMQQYKDLADNLQGAIDNQAEVTKSIEGSLRAAQEDRDSLKASMQILEKLKQEIQEESKKESEENHRMIADLRRERSKIQSELQEAVRNLSEADCQASAAREDCKRQSQLAAETQDKYQRELMLHAADVEALTTVKKQLEEFNTKFSVEQETRQKAESALAEYKESWEEQEKIYKQEIEKLEARCQDLNKQNSIVHDQMEKMSREVMSIQQAVTRQENAGTSADTSFSEDSSKSSEQLLEVVKFLRREKEIAESRLEIIQAESNTFKQRYERIEKELQDVTKTLTEEQVKAQTNLQTAAQHTELMRKVENLNILSDSNKLLREDKERLEQLKEELEAKVNKLESDINPLQVTIRDVTAQRDAITDERETLKGEVERWKSRTNHLIEQANKTDPEEHKKLQQEKERISKELKSANEDNQKLKTEVNRLNSSLQNAQQETSQIKQEVTTLNKTIGTMKKEAVEKNADMEEKNKTIFQLKKIGRKYKEQAETVGKELEETKQQLESAKETQSKQEQTPSTAVIEQHTAPIREELEAAKKERDETKQQLEEQTTKWNVTKDQVTQLEQNISKLNAENVKLKGEKEDYEKKLNQSRTVLLTAKKKIASQTEEIEKLSKEVAELKDRLNSNTQQSNEENEIKMTSMKLDYENQIQEVEKKLNEEKGILQAKILELESSLEKITQENTELQSRLKQLESQPSQTKPVAPQPQGPSVRPSTTVPVDRARVVERNVTSTSESPKMANIKPMSSPATIRPQTSQNQLPMGSARVMASIRPMAIAPTAATPVTISVPTPTATVMPTTVQHESTDQGDSVSQLSPVTTSRPTQQVQRVTPQVETSNDQPAVIELENSGQLQHEATSDSQSVVSSSVATVTREVTPTAVQTVSSTSQLGKRMREDMESQEEETEAKRTKTIIPQEPQAAVPSITVTDEHANTTTVPQEGVKMEEDTGTSEVVLVSESDVSQTTSTKESQSSLAPSDSMSTVSTEVTPMPSASTSTESQEMVSDSRPEESATTVTEEPSQDSNAIIILESDEEEYGEEEAEEEDEGDEEDYEDVGEDDDQEDYEEDEEDNDTSGEVSESQQDMSGEAQDFDEYNVVVVEDDNEGDIESRQDDTPIPSQRPVTTATSNLFTMRPATGMQPIERQSSITRQLTPFVIGSHAGFEDGEDGIVPSTPTLCIPNRGDGYAEVVSSPHVSNQRFTFGSIADQAQNQSELAQLASQGALGMDDTRMDLSQLEEGTGRSVPSTPLHSTAPASIITEGTVESKLAARPEESLIETTPSTTEGETQGETLENLSERTEEGVEGEEVTVGEGEMEEATELQTGDKADSATADKDDDTEGTTQQPEKSEQAEKPKIQPIVWESSSSSSPSSSVQPSQPFRGRQTAIRGLGMPQRGMRQHRGGFQRMRSPVPRQRGPRGGRGGMYRPPMF